MKFNIRKNNNTNDINVNIDNNNESLIDDGYTQISFNDYSNNLNSELDLTKEEENELNSTKKSNKIIPIIIATSLLSSSVTLLGANHIFKYDTPTSTEKIIVNNSSKTNVYNAVAKKSTQSVVGITTITVNRDNPFSLPTQYQGLGSGVIVDKNGYILTNSHVVSNGEATNISVIFSDGDSVDGEVLWHDAQLDLAVVKVEGKKNLQVADLGDSDEIEVGDLAIAIGNPLGLEFNKSVTQGIISGLERTIPTDYGDMTGLIQTDASINPGNSGGPLLNENGEVIGINTAKVSDAEGLGFTIPINVAKPIVSQVIKNGDFEKVVLGIKGINVPQVESLLGVKLSVDEGVYIIETTEDTPARKSGLSTGNIITKVNKTKIKGMSDLNKALYEYKKGDVVDFTVFKDGASSVIKVKF